MIIRYVPLASYQRRVALGCTLPKNRLGNLHPSLGRSSSSRCLIVSKTAADKGTVKKLCFFGLTCNIYKGAKQRTKATQAPSPGLPRPIIYVVPCSKRQYRTTRPNSRVQLLHATLRRNKEETFGDGIVPFDSSNYTITKVQCSGPRTCQLRSFGNNIWTCGREEKRHTMQIILRFGAGWRKCRLG